jgi:hypothetical protein
MIDLEAFLQTHPITLEVTHGGGVPGEHEASEWHDTYSLELGYQGRTLSYPWAQVAGRDDPDVATVLACLVAEARTDERGDEQLRSLLGDDAELLTRPARSRARAAVTNEQLQAAGLAVQRSEPAYIQDRETRNRLIKQALKQGMMQAHVARMVGLSREAVRKIGEHR